MSSAFSVQRWRVCLSCRQLPQTFWMLALLVALMLLLRVALGPALGTGFDLINQWVYRYFGPVYLAFGLLALALSVLVAVSGLGKTRVGGQAAGQADTGAAAFDFFSWFAMLFCAGMGTGFMFWGGGEPLYHFLNPPFSTDASGLSAHQQAFSFTFLHWGLIPWSIYALTAAAISHFCLNPGKPLSFRTLIGNRRHHFAVDCLTLVAIVFGIAATCGMGVLMIISGLGQVGVHIPETMQGWMPFLITLVMTAVFLYSAYRGLSNGIRVLSVTSVSLTLALMLFIFVQSSPARILDTLQSGIVSHLQTFLPTSLAQGPYQPADWPREWTMKYWSWWIAWAPFVGTFIALISKGRSMRQMIAGAILAPALMSWIWFAIFGQSAIDGHQQGWLSHDVNLDGIQNVWYELMRHFGNQAGGVGHVLALLSVALLAIFVCDSVDSAVYTLASITHQADANDASHAEEPPFHLSLAWGVLIAALTCLLLVTGGFEILQDITLIMVLPFTLLLGYAFFRLSGAACQKLGRPASGPTKKSAPSSSTDL